MNKFKKKLEAQISFEKYLYNEIKKYSDEIIKLLDLNWDNIEYIVKNKYYLATKNFVIRLIENPFLLHFDNNGFYLDEKYIFYVAFNSASDNTLEKTEKTFNFKFRNFYILKEETYNLLLKELENEEYEILENYETCNN